MNVDGQNIGYQKNAVYRNLLLLIFSDETLCAGFGITISQFFADGDMVEMTPEIKELFDSWVSLTAEQKKAVMQMIRTLNSNK